MHFWEAHKKYSVQLFGQQILFGQLHNALFYQYTTSPLWSKMKLGLSEFFYIIWTPELQCDRDKLQT